MSGPADEAKKQNKQNLFFTTMTHRFVTFLTCLMAIGLYCHADIRTQEQAEAIATQFMNSAVIQPAAPQRQLTPCRTNDEQQDKAFYVFNAMDGKGFVIVSAESKARTILAYSDKGSFLAGDMPANVRFWLTRYAEEIHTLSASSIVPIQNVSVASTSAIVSPLLEIDNIQWDQDSPFNDQCPMLNGTHCVTGCVPTAFGQIMRYWKYPARGIGSNSYVWNGRTLSADFSQHFYDWNNMLGTYSSFANSAQKQAVALLLSDIGIACDINYGNNASSSNEIKAARALLQYFDYDAGMSVASMDYMGLGAFGDAIMEDLLESRPVIMTGNTTNSGHAFVCDGVDNNNMFHINWGWSGRFNGYFALSALNPAGQGIGGDDSGEGYNRSVSAILHIQPNQHSGNMPVQMFMKKYVLNNSQRIAKTDKISTTIVGMKNYGLSDWSGQVGTAIFDTHYNFIDWLSAKTSSLESGYFFTYDVSIPSAKWPASIANGDYILAPAVLQSSDISSQPVFFDAVLGNVTEYRVKVTADSVFFTMPLDMKYMYNLTAQDNQNETMTFSWEAHEQADKYVVEVTSGDFLISRDTVSALSANVRFYDMGQYRYSWTLYALDDTNQLLATSYGDDFVIEVTTDYTPSGLQSNVLAHSIEFSWQGNAPAYQLELLDDHKQLLLRDFTKGCTYHVDARLKNGTYFWGVRALNKEATYYISDEVTASFNVMSDDIIPVKIQDNVTKYIRQGRLYIRKNGWEYTVDGDKTDRTLTK